jgi:hypothetical protein
MNATRSKSLLGELRWFATMGLAAVVFVGTVYILCQLGKEENRLTIAGETGGGRYSTEGDRIELY